MNSKPLGRMEIDMKKCINVLLMMLMLADLVGCGKNCESKENTNMERELVAVDSNEETNLSIENLDGVQYESDWEKNGQSAENSAENQSNIDYGIEVRADISGDGKTDRVRVVDTVSGDYAFTQVCAILNGGSDFFIDYLDSWTSSYLIAGDLNGNGAADVVVLRYYTGSTYNGCAVSVLHMVKNDFGENDFEEYPSAFIQNSKFSTEQPAGFGEGDGFSCIGASIIEKNGKSMLRLIACIDPLSGTVQCVDCSYKTDGWYIEDLQIVSDYWENDKKLELLGYSY